MNTLLSVLLGVGLSAACGFRISVPFLLVGIAGTVQALTVGTRKVSLLTTGGLGNPLVSSVELFGSVLLTVLAWALFFGVRHLLRLMRGAGGTAA